MEKGTVIGVGVIICDNMRYRRVGFGVLERERERERETDTERREGT